MDYSLPDEMFVKVPGIIEIRWTSDDCEYYVVPTDLIEEQGKGLPDTYGKKDKRTTEQAIFWCHLCQCELKSVKTLRLHCGVSSTSGRPRRRRKNLETNKSLATNQFLLLHRILRSLRGMMSRKKSCREDQIPPG